MGRNLLTFSELSLIPTWEERLEYLKCPHSVGEDRFAHQRYLNQNFYRSSEWHSVRDAVITRDWARDLGVEGYELTSHILVHHMVPLLPEDFIEHSDFLLNPEFLITVSDDTHRRIHYGDMSVPKLPQVRTPFDTCPWKEGKGVYLG